MKSPAVGVLFWAVVGLAIGITSDALATTIFKDTFESGTPGTNVGAPWGINTISPATYQSASNPFPSGSIYADLTDPGTGTNPSQAIRLQSNAGGDNTLSPSLAGQVTTYSFDFWEPSRTGDINNLVFGYYRQQANPDLNSAGRNYSSLMHDGTLSPQGTVVGGAAVTYSLETMNTVFMMANDSASPVVNYAGTGLTLAATTADVWISKGGAAPIYAFSVSRQNVTPPANNTASSGVGFRTNNADIERFFIDNVLVTSDATFDRTAVPEPASFVLLSIAIAVIGMTTGRGR